MDLFHYGFTGIILCILLFFTVCVIILVYAQVYHWIILMGILLFSCVSIEPSPSDLVLAAVIPLGLITGVYRPKLQGKALTAVLILFAYFLVSLPGILFARDQMSSLRYYFITLFLFFVAVFACTYASRENVNSLLMAYVAAACVSFLAGLIGYLGFFPDLLMADEFRVKGLFKDPNVFGPFFVPAILVLIDDINRKALFKIFIITLLTLGVVFSFSRAAWINLAVSVLVYFLLNIKALHSGQIIRMLLAALFVFTIVAGLFLSPLLSDTGTTEFIQERAKLQEYDRERFNAQHGGLELIVQNPLGYGPGQFEDEIDQVTQFKIDAHSLYIRMAVENGVLGFLLFFAALLYMLLELLLHGKAAAKKHAGTGTISPAAAIAILCGILVNSLVVDTIHWRHFWFFIGIGLYCLKEMREEQQLLEIRKGL